MENNIPLNEESRYRQVSMLGGIRAYDQYRSEKFKPDSKTSSAFEAANSFDYTKENLYFCGPTGSGKSHLATVAARRVFESRQWWDSVSTISQMEISRRLRGCANAMSEQEVIEFYASRPVLVIEDLGVAKDTEFLLSTVYEIINSRYQDKPTGLIVTSNLSLGQIAQKFGDDRIPSRLAELCKVFNLSGVKDHRLNDKMDKQNG